jgi:hypothetical protein
MVSEGDVDIRSNRRAGSFTQFIGVADVRAKVGPQDIAEFERKWREMANVSGLLADVATPVPGRPSAAQVAAERALTLNSAMLGIYDAALARYQENFLANCPVILGLFTGAGGEFTLYRPGQAPIEAPAPPVGYQVVKSAGHSSMAVYQLVAPFLGDPESTAWRGPMETYRLQQRQVLECVDDLPIPGPAKEAVEAILSANVAFMDRCLDTGTFDLEALEQFAQPLKPFFQAAIGYCAEVQVSHWMGVLDEWKQLLGDAWERTYGVTNTLWVTRTNNILFTVMAQFFGRHAFNDRLLLLETTQFTTEHETMLNLLTRIVADRALGKVFFKDYYLMDVELVSTGARDAVASEMARRVPASGGAYMVFSGHEKILEEARARGLEPLMPPLAPFHSQEWPWRTDATQGEGPKTLADVQ